MGSPTQTTNYSLNKPVVGEESTPLQWGEYINSDLDTIDSQMKAEENYGSGLSGFISSLSSQVSTNTGNIATNSSNITKVIAYSSGINSGIVKPLNYNYERPPFNAVRIEMGSGLNAEQYITVTEGLDETDNTLYVQATSSGLAYQEHLDVYFPKVFPKGAAFGTSKIAIDYDMVSSDSTLNKIIATVYKNGVAETPETIVKAADHTWNSTLQAYDGNIKHVWHFEGTGNESDSVGAGTLTAQGTIAQVTGKYNYARQLEAVNSEFFTGSPASIMGGSGDFTISMLARCDSTPTTTPGYLISKNRNDMGGDSPIWYVSIYKSGLNYIVAFYLFDDTYGSTTTTVTLAGGDPNGKWLHIVARYEASANTIFIDVGDVAAGTAQSNSNSSVSGSSQWNMDTAGFYIGAFYWDYMTAYDLFDGTIDEFYYWDTKLSDTAVSDLFYSGNLRFYGYAGSSGPYVMTNIGTGWAGGDEMLLKTELWTKDDNYVRLYGINFDIG